MFFLHIKFITSLFVCKTKGWNRRPANQHQYLENASVALKAIEEDGIKLVNIGKILIRVR